MPKERLINAELLTAKDDDIDTPLIATGYHGHQHAILRALHVEAAFRGHIPFGYKESHKPPVFI